MKRYLIIGLAILLSGCGIEKQPPIESAVERNCKIVDEDLEVNQWHTLRNESMGFEIRYPGFIDSQLGDQIRLQNYTDCKLERTSLESGEYYLSIRNLFKKCEQEYPELKKIILSDGKIAWERISQLGQGEGDTGGTSFIRCINKESGSLIISITENSRDGIFAKRILNTVQLLK